MTSSSRARARACSPRSSSDSAHQSRVRQRSNEDLRRSSPSMPSAKWASARSCSPSAADSRPSTDDTAPQIEAPFQAIWPAKGSSRSRAVAAA